MSVVWQFGRDGESRSDRGSDRAPSGDDVRDDFAGIDGSSTDVMLERTTRAAVTDWVLFGRASARCQLFRPRPAVPAAAFVAAVVDSQAVRSLTSWAMFDQAPSRNGGDTMAEDGLLDEVRAAAEAALEARATGAGSGEPADRALAAARSALDGGHAISAIAAAEVEGERAARARVGAQVLRAVERSAKKLRDASAEYERSIGQAVQLGLVARDIASRAGVSHGTVAAVARRHAQAVAAPSDGAAHASVAEAPGTETATAAEAG